MTALRPTSSIELPSGHICFGALHNIHHGLSAPLQQGFPQFPAEPQSVGTVKAQLSKYNLAAKKGKWNVFPLVDVSNHEQFAGYFLSHESVEPRAEIDKILRIAPSPYEYDSEEPCQSRWNDENSRSHRVSLVSRYDWGWTDRRSFDEVYGADGDLAEDYNYEDAGSAVGVVDYAHATDVLRRWQGLSKNSLRAQMPEKNGIWLWLRQHEYEFGRFGFDEELKYAQSFLFFSSYTDFSKTLFLSDSQNEQPLTRLETAEERFERRLNQGWDFSGLKTLREMYFDANEGVEKNVHPLPPSDQLLGPYPREQYILDEANVDALRQHRSEPATLEIPASEDGTVPKRVITLAKTAVLHIAGNWKDSVFELVNEIVLAWIQHDVVPVISTTEDAQTAANMLFPDYQDGKSLGAQCRQRFLASSGEEIQDFDAMAVEQRLQSFLYFNDVPDDHKGVIDGILRVLAYVVGDILELAAQRSVDAGRIYIVPDQVRLSIVTLRDQEDSPTGEGFLFSRVLWQDKSQ